MLSQPAEMQGAHILLFLVLAWAVAWISFSFVFSRISGWNALARVYPGRDVIGGQRWYFQTAVFRRFFTSRAAQTVRADQEGVTFSALLFFRVGMPPFSVPWREISGRETRWGFGRAVELHFQRVTSIPVTIGSRLADKLEEASLGQWHYERITVEGPGS